MHEIPAECLLGRKHNHRISSDDQKRQRLEVEEILRRFDSMPGLILADEVGMGKTYVALAVAYAAARGSSSGPVVLMVPPGLVSKWVSDLHTFAELYLDNRRVVDCRESRDRSQLRHRNILRYGIARTAVDYLKFFDDPRPEQPHLLFLTQGAMARGLDDAFIQLALIRETFHQHRKNQRLTQVHRHIHKYAGDLLWSNFRNHGSRLKKDIWRELLAHDPGDWMEVFNINAVSALHHLDDDPVPAHVMDIIRDPSLLDLKPLAYALEELPVRARGGEVRVKQRVAEARGSLRATIQELWKLILSMASWRSPLLVLDEAHHLKNPDTALARMLQNPKTVKDMNAGGGSLSSAFDRMLFLTATPFQLGHAELIRIMQRFGDVRWTKALGNREDFRTRLNELHASLDGAQRASIRLNRNWKRVQNSINVQQSEVDAWWDRIILDANQESDLVQRLLSVFREAVDSRQKAEKLIQPWIVRHNKGEVWVRTAIPRRRRVSGAGVMGDTANSGIQVPPRQLLPFFLAARSSVEAIKDLLGEALSSSYEAFRDTRLNNRVQKDDATHTDGDGSQTISKSSWYLQRFDDVIQSFTGAIHPKISATVSRVVDLWERGEKVLVFAFYIETCRALRVHISEELERRMYTLARKRLGKLEVGFPNSEVDRLIESIQNRYFDTADAPGRRSLDTALLNILEPYRKELSTAALNADDLVPIMRRFLRVPTTLVRAFPLVARDASKHDDTVQTMLSACDSSNTSWAEKFRVFVEFLLRFCATEERRSILEAAESTQTGRIRMDINEAARLGDDAEDSVRTLANVQMATGKTKQEARRKLMLAFNTPFFPDILVASSVMGEGIDLHKYCRFVIHHDLDWNPSAIEQRTGRVDRIGCKAEGKHSIEVHLPYIAGAADERQFHVMTEREEWFKVVMGQDTVDDLASTEDEATLLPPSAMMDTLMFRLGL